MEYFCICRDFVTGFRKRKQQRRKEAVRSLEKLQRENKLEERAERREARREQFDLKCDGEDSIDGNSARGERDCENPKNVEQVFDGHETRSTVKVSVITTEFEEDEKQDKRMKTTFNSNVGSSSKSVEVDRQKKNGTGHKLSKTALAVLSNTKLKIEGKRKFSVHNAKKNMKSGSLSKGNDRHKKGRK